MGYQIKKKHYANMEQPINQYEDKNLDIIKQTRRFLGLFNLDEHSLVTFMQALASSDLAKRIFRLPLLDSGLAWTRRIVPVLKCVIKFMKFYAGQRGDDQLEKNLERLIVKTIEPKVTQFPNSLSRASLSNNLFEAPLVTHFAPGTALHTFYAKHRSIKIL